MSFAKYKPRPAKQYEGVNPSKARETVVCIVDTRRVLVIPIEKAVRAKPGKRTPTIAEAAWMDAIVAHGCVACRKDGNGVVAPHVHHILRGGRRIGHLFTLPLCPSHHQDDGRPGYVARHPWKKRFEQLYGSETLQLGQLQVELGFFDSWSAQ